MTNPFIEEYYAMPGNRERVEADSGRDALGWTVEALGKLHSDRNQSVVEHVLFFSEHALIVESVAELEVAYGMLGGYIKCSNDLKLIDQQEMEQFSKIGKQLYRAAQARLQGADASDREQHGIAALDRLLQRNLHEGGSGATAVKGVLLGLYNSDAFPFKLTALRNLDSQNFDDVIAVLQMNARCMPKREIHEYYENGDQIWGQMWNEFKPKNTDS